MYQHTNSTFTNSSFTMTIQDKNLFFHIRDLGALSSGSKPPIAHEGLYRILITTGGSYRYTVGKRFVELHPDTLGLIRPGDQFELYEPEGATGYILTFSRSFLRSVLGSSAVLEALQFNLADKQVVAMPTSEVSFLGEVMKRLLEEYLEKGAKGEMIFSLFHIIIQYLKRNLTSIPPASVTKNQYHIKRFFLLLEEHFRTCKMPGDYAGLMSVTPSYLNYVIKEAMGNTTSYFIHQRILAEAKRMASNHEFNMKEIAYKLGFEDTSHFSKFFKRISGEKFMEFKRSLAA